MEKSAEYWRKKAARNYWLGLTFTFAGTLIGSVFTDHHYKKCHAEPTTKDFKCNCEQIVAVSEKTIQSDTVRSTQFDLELKPN